MLTQFRALPGCELCIRQREQPRDFVRYLTRDCAMWIGGRGNAEASERTGVMASKHHLQRKLTSFGQRHGELKDRFARLAFASVRAPAGLGIAIDRQRRGGWRAAHG